MFFLPASRFLDSLADGVQGRVLTDGAEVGARQAVRVGRDGLQTHLLGHGLAALCTRRIARRSGSSGSGISTTTSKRPGRSKAGSTMSGRLVAAKTSTPVSFSIPSSSARNWPTTRSLTCASDAPPPRRGTSASISSKNTRHGGRLLGLAKDLADGSFRLADVLRQQGRPLDRDKIDLGRAGRRLGEQRLAAAGRPGQENSLQWLDPSRLKQCTILQRPFQRLAQQALRPLEPAHVLPGGGGHLDKHLAQGGGLHVAQGGQEILLAQFELQQGFIRKRGLGKVNLRQDSPHADHGRLATERFQVGAHEPMRDVGQPGADPRPRPRACRGYESPGSPGGRDGPESG